MKLQKPTEFTNTSGAMMLLYGDTGVGKTISTILSTPGNLILLHFETRPISKMMEVIRELEPEIDKRLRIADYIGWVDFLEFLYNDDNFTKADAILADNVTDLMTTKLKDEIDVESWDARSDKDKDRKPLIMQSKSGLEGMGAANIQMARMMNGLGRQALRGKTVICTGLKKDDPKYDLQLHAGPAFIGRQFVDNLGSWFTHIGLVSPRKVDGEIVFPPEVAFNSDGSFMARWGGKPNSPKRYMLNINYILQN